MQTDDRKVTVKIEGDGKFLGIDNGDLRRQKSFAGNELNTYFGKALVVVQSTRKAGKMKVYMTVEGIEENYIIEIDTDI